MITVRFVVYRECPEGHQNGNLLVIFHRVPDGNLDHYCGENTT